MAKRLPAKPRIRKDAPTIREKADVAQAEAAKPQRRRLKRTRKVLSRLRLPRNRATRPIFRIAGFVKRFIIWIIPDYFIAAFREIRLVTWPSRIETWRLTSAVFIFAIVFGIFVAAVDKSLDEIFKKLILK